MTCESNAPMTKIVVILACALQGAKAGIRKNEMNARRIRKKYFF